MTFLTDLIPTLLVLGILILIHEWGHFIACRLSKVQVEKFSIGFGPEIFHFQGKETKYVVSLFPLGGFVKPAGESASELGTEGPKPHDYLAASVWKRIFIVIAGVAMNYLLAFLIFSGIFMMGRPIPQAVIGGFVEGYPAFASGLAKGDHVLAVGGTQVGTWQELTDALSRLTTEEAELLVLRGSQTQTVRVPLRIETVPDVFGKSHRLARLGIKPDPEVYRIEKLSFGVAVKEAFLTELELAAMTYKALYYLATGHLSLKTLSGPLGIMSMTGTAVKMGLIYILHLTAVLSVSLAVINLLPIPALDGGHLAFLIIEAVLRRQVSIKFQERATQVGFAFLMILMAFVLYNDLVNLQVIDRVKSVLGR